MSYLLKEIFDENKAFDYFHNNQSNYETRLEALNKRLGLLNSILFDTNSEMSHVNETILCLEDLISCEKNKCHSKAPLESAVIIVETSVPIKSSQIKVNRLDNANGANTKDNRNEKLKDYISKRREAVQSEQKSSQKINENEKSFKSRFHEYKDKAILADAKLSLLKKKRANFLKLKNKNKSKSNKNSFKTQIAKDKSNFDLKKGNLADKFDMNVYMKDLKEKSDIKPVLVEKELKQEEKVFKPKISEAKLKDSKEQIKPKKELIKKQVETLKEKPQIKAKPIVANEKKKAIISKPVPIIEKGSSNDDIIVEDLNKKPETASIKLDLKASQSKKASNPKQVKLEKENFAPNSNLNNNINANKEKAQKRMFYNPPTNFFKN